MDRTHLALALVGSLAAASVVGVAISSEDAPSQQVPFDDGHSHTDIGGEMVEPLAHATTGVTLSAGMHAFNATSDDENFVIVGLHESPVPDGVWVEVEVISRLDVPARFHGHLAFGFSVLIDAGADGSAQ